MTEILRALREDALNRREALLEAGDARAWVSIFCPLCDQDYVPDGFLPHVGSVECGQYLIDQKVLALIEGRA